jgi:hypothetical protein
MSWNYLPCINPKQGKRKEAQKLARRAKNEKTAADIMRTGRVPVKDLLPLQIIGTTRPRL